MRISALIIVLISLWSCSHELPPKDSIHLIGHGGEGFSNLSARYAPNSVASIRRALEVYELDGVEVDVRYTADSNFIVYHDAYLEHSTQCKGIVKSLNLEETVGCYYRKQFNNSYTEQVISLDSLITLINTEWNDVPISIQVQATETDNAILEKMAVQYSKRLRRINYPKNIKTECNNGNFLFYLRRIYDYECHLIAQIDTTSMKDIKRFGLQGIVSRFDQRDYDVERELKKNDIYISLYGHKITRHYKDWTYDYIDAIQVDNPIKAIQYFGN
jgi:glycerophosphoryl diester phosphodiesterase